MQQGPAVSKGAGSPVNPIEMARIPSGYNGSLENKSEASHDGFSFCRSKGSSLIAITNRLSYLMAEYSDQTGATKWRRVVPAGQREKVEQWLQENYPVRA